MTEVKESINSKIEKLDEALEWFYSDEFELDKAAEKYEAVMKLTKEIETDLEKLKNKITVIQKDFAKK